MPSRRQFLAGLATGGTGGIAGCLGSDSDDAADAAGDATDWPTFGHDTRNTNYNPQGSAPTASPTERWRVESFQISAQPVLADGTVYAPVGADVLAIDAESGDVKWSADPDNRGAIYWAPPTVHEGVVYLGDGDERLRAFDAETGEVLWQRTFGGEPFEGIYSTPTVTIRGLTVGTAGGTVYTLDPETGEAVWKTSVFGRIESTLASDPPLIYAVTSGGDVYTFGTGGRGYWQTGLPNTASGTPAVVDGRAYVGCDDGKLYAIDSDGTIAWSTAVGGFARGGVAVADGRVFAADGIGLTAVDAEGGRRLWRSRADVNGSATPVVVGDTVYVAGDKLYGFAVDGGIGVDLLRVGERRFGEPFDGGVGHVAAGDGLLVAGVSENQDDHYVVGFE
ncbi:Outer membrane protein assembly factor BamB, contains PQQ-like beta-propeller repeat [Halogranum gelatinilyticum]|uniref:Outer membrane protein assembly factor BamB, contains PQQ-like beta-propeller repeat n=1 Tax=Halogranum gelatinilyticum TaxID=660521 RepID=A0A1G9UCK1_9EURY|nr:PQQ-binding-like beta-propeller repeat protein [Halogranum gelatinilyticum]SDM57660.1 Outer membrane protein assembly factor BamB, contains PQQ-like beta-propeller repeat [Halogranum gelatinilyticum]